MLSEFLACVSDFFIRYISDIVARESKLIFCIISKVFGCRSNEIQVNI